MAEQTQLSTPHSELAPAAMTWQLNAPPSWPPPPADFTPAPDWTPDPSWPRPPRRWRLWKAAPAPPEASWPLPDASTTSKRVLRDAPPLGRPPLPQQRARLRHEILVVLAIFPLPAVLSAIAVLIRGAVEGDRHDVLTVVLEHHPLPSALLGALLYAGALSVIPLVWFVLSADGLGLRALGLSWRQAHRESGAGVLLAVGGFSIVVLILVVARLVHVTDPPGTYATHFPHVARIYLLQAVAISIVTAVVEETVVNGYLQTRLAQLGWSTSGVFWTSLGVRTTYHVYYGLGAVLTLPVGFLLTRSFQRRRRLLRCVIAHAVYDSVLFTAALLSS